MLNIKKLSMREDEGEQMVPFFFLICAADGARMPSL